MEDQDRFTEMSTEEFRGLQEAPLVSDEDDAADDDLRSALDADVDDEILESDLDEELPEQEDISTGLSRPGFEVVLQSDMDGDEEETNSIHTSDMVAPDAPGQVDIEDLPDDALDDTDLPADARLDPLEP